MLVSWENMKMLEHKWAKFIPWKHASNRSLEHLCGVLFEQACKRNALHVTKVSTVANVLLLLCLLPLQHNIFGVDHYDVVTHYLMRRPGDFVLSIEHTCNTSREAAKGLVFRINDVPIGSLWFNSRCAHSLGGYVFLFRKGSIYKRNLYIFRTIPFTPADGANTREARWAVLVSLNEDFEYFARGISICQIGRAHV